MSKNVPEKWQTMAHYWVDGAPIQRENVVQQVGTNKWYYCPHPSWSSWDNYRIAPANLELKDRRWEVVPLCDMDRRMPLYRGDRQDPLTFTTREGAEAARNLQLNPRQFGVRYIESYAGDGVLPVPLWKREMTAGDAQDYAEAVSLETRLPSVPVRHRVLAHKWVDGADIQLYNPVVNLWVHRNIPGWHEDYQYRLEPENTGKPSIDWNPVDKKFQFLTRDSYGEVRLWSETPRTSITTGYAGWVCGTGVTTHADGFASLKRGTCDWKDSLVMRPENS